MAWVNPESRKRFESWKSLKLSFLSLLKWEFPAYHIFRTRRLFNSQSKSRSDKNGNETLTWKMIEPSWLLFNSRSQKRINMRGYIRIGSCHVSTSVPNVNFFVWSKVGRRQQFHATLSNPYIPSPFRSFSVGLDRLKKKIKIKCRILAAQWQTVRRVAGTRTRAINARFTTHTNLVQQGQQ
jgi:hypothetical protein